jgi:hypothetical protein
MGVEPVAPGAPPPPARPQSAVVAEPAPPGAIDIPPGGRVDASGIVRDAFGRDVRLVQAQRERRRCGVAP